MPLRRRGSLACDDTPLGPSATPSASHLCPRRRLPCRRQRSRYSVVGVGAVLARLVAVARTGDRITACRSRRRRWRPRGFGLRLGWRPRPRWNQGSLSQPTSLCRVPPVAMLASSIPERPGSGRWAFEPKYDGYRLNPLILRLMQNRAVDSCSASRRFSAEVAPGFSSR
jgi:hypothetical protein